MKALLICPGERSGVPSLCRATPLANSVILGRPLLIHWLEHLFERGVKEVRIVACDRAHQVCTLVDEGSRWGMQINVLLESRELTAAEARSKYLRAESAASPEVEQVFVLDHLPELAAFPLFDSYQSWFMGVNACLQKHAARNHVGARELRPGVWVGVQARISPQAELRAPCWIGGQVTIAEDAIIGPDAVIEDGSMIERGTEITASHVAPETFLGTMLELRQSLAQGGTLISWSQNSSVMISDAFLMSSMSSRSYRDASTAWFGRLAALLAMLLTLPLALVPLLKAKLLRRNSLKPLVAVEPCPEPKSESCGSLVYYEFAEARGWLRRWPQLWKIARGDFRWVGNHPLSPAEAGSLVNDFERLWLSTPIGFISLAQAEGVTDKSSDEARAYATYYATHASLKLDLSILAKHLLGSKKPLVTAAYRYMANTARRGGSEFQQAIGLAGEK